jgi:hypothetical protein
LPVPVPQRAFDDPRKASAPVVAVPGEQAQAIPLTLNDQAIAVVLDFVKPVGDRRDNLAAGREAEAERASHGPKIGARARNCESRTARQLDGSSHGKREWPKTKGAARA